MAREVGNHYLQVLSRTRKRKTLPQRAKVQSYTTSTQKKKDTAVYYTHELPGRMHNSKRGQGVRAGKDNRRDGSATKKSTYIPHETHNAVNS